MPKLYPTRLTFADIQRSEYSAKTPAPDAKMEFPELNVPAIDLRYHPIARERRASRAIRRDRDPRVREFVPKVPDHERAGLP